MDSCWRTKVVECYDPLCSAYGTFDRFYEWAFFWLVVFIRRVRAEISNAGQ